MVNRKTKKFISVFFIVFFVALNVSLPALEQLLHRYTMESTTKPFDVRSVPVQPVVEPTKSAIEKVSGVSQGPTDVVQQRENAYNEKLSSIPEFAHLGTIFKSASPVDLAESEVEYVVRCVKHVFGHYIVFQVKKLLHFFSFFV